MLYRWLGKSKATVFTLFALALLFAVACGAAATATPVPKPAAKPEAPKAPVAAAPAAPSVPQAAPTTVPVAKPEPAAPVVATHKSTGELTVAVAVFGNERWHPSRIVGVEDAVYNPIYENLLAMHPQTGETIGELATSWAVREGGKVWEFKLRKGAQFHEGWGEVTAEDVQLSAESFAAEGSSNARNAIFKKVEKYEIPDPYTIILRLKTADVLLQNHLNSGVLGTQYVFPKKYITTVGEQKADEKPIGSGPYRLVKHVRGDRLLMEAVENHWRLTPAFAKLTILKVPEDSTRVAMVRAGAVDIITIGIDNFKELKAAKVKVFEVADFATVGVTLGGQWRTKATFDPKVPWVGDPKDPASMERAKKVRLAFNLAVDKPAVINAALGGLAEPVAVSAFFQGRRSTPAELKPRGYDLAQAKKLMAEAGYPNCFAFTVNLVAWPGREYLPQVGEAVATQLEANLGCQIKRRPLDRAIFEKHFRDRTYAGEMLAWAAPALGTEAWEIWNLVGYSPGTVHLLAEDPQIDAFLEKLSATPDAEERVKIMQDMARFIYDLAPRIEIGAAKAIFGAGERVKTWPLVPSNAFLPNLDYVNLVWAPPGQPVVLAK